MGFGTRRWRGPRARRVGRAGDRARPVPDRRRPRVRGDPERAATLDEIEAGLDRITVLVDELHILARADAGVLDLTLEPTDLAQAPAAAVDAMAPLAASHRLTIGLDLPPATAARKD